MKEKSFLELVSDLKELLDQSESRRIIPVIIGRLFLLKLLSLGGVVLFFLIFRYLKNKRDKKFLFC
jgi:hypothetical protein